jgi:class 3 adenylate cyclase
MKGVLVVVWVLRSWSTARVAALAGLDEVLVSRTIRDLIAGAPIRLESRGRHRLKGVPGTWEVFAVVS